MITGLYAGILAVVFVILSFNVIVRRVKNRMPYGDNNNADLMHAVRIHGNFAEYVPFVLILMMLYEKQAGSLYIVHAVGITLIIARLLHMIGLHSNIIPARIGGTALTQLLMAILAVLLILKGITALQVL